MKWPILILFLLIPSTFAFDCSTFTGLNRSNCDTLSKTNESLIANLIYTSHFIPDHSFISEYNRKITVNKPPNGTKVTNGSYIKNAWLSILTVQPSVQNDSALLVGSPFEIRSEYGYSVAVPSTFTDSKKREGRTCRIEYSLKSNIATLKVQSGSVSSSQKLSYFVVSQPARFDASVTIKVSITADTYKWKYSNQKWSCKYLTTDTLSETLTPKESINITPKITSKPVSAIIGQPYSATQRILINSSDRNLKLDTNASSISLQFVYYSAVFTKPPYNFLQLVSSPTNTTISNNTYKNGDLLAVPQTDLCTINSYDYFSKNTLNCTKGNVTLESAPKITAQKNNWYLVALIITIGFVIYGILRILKTTWGKYFLAILLLIATIPTVHGSDCGLSNLGSCIPESIYDFILSVVNAGFEPLLNAINFFLTQPVSIDIFFPIWQIVIYILGFFYVIMLAFAGFKFLTSGHDILKREQAKEWLKNAFLAIIFTSASFYMYQLVIEVSATVTGSIMSMVPSTFFKITIDSITNVALEFFYSISYLLVLLVTLLLFSLRYILVAIGVIFVPFGVFCYFVPPLKGYGNLILQLVGVLNIIPIFCGLVALACSKLIGVGIFVNFKILLMLSAFSFMDLLLIIGLWHIVNASGLKGAVDKTISAGKYIAALVA